MLFKMSDDKKTSVEPTVIIATPQAFDGETGPKKNRLTKKHVVIAVIALLVTGLIVTGALVGIKIYTDSSLEILKYTLKANGLSQNVSVDGNSVMYHVKKDGGVEAWIVQDFDKGFQVTKQVVDGGASACFVTALNRSIASDASSIPDVTPDTSGASSNKLSYKALPDPIVDLTFLGKKASTMCQNIPTYHAVPDCGQSEDLTAKAADNSTTTDVGHRSKRGVGACGYLYYYGTKYACVCGCCYRVCATVYAQCTLYYDTTRRVYYCVYYTIGSVVYYSLAPSCTYNNVYYNSP